MMVDGAQERVEGTCDAYEIPQKSILSTALDPQIVFLTWGEFCAEFWRELQGSQPTRMQKLVSQEPT